MRIPIREQLGLLVLLTSLVALAVVAIATVCIPHANNSSSFTLLILTKQWITNYRFVLGVRLVLSSQPP